MSRVTDQNAERLKGLVRQRPVRLLAITVKAALRDVQHERAEPVYLIAFLRHTPQGSRKKNRRILSGQLKDSFRFRTYSAIKRPLDRPANSMDRLAAYCITVRVSRAAFHTLLTDIFGVS